MTGVIEVTGLTKRYGGRRVQAVVDGISFHVDQGEIFGILGPNGAGKTTAVECMEGLRQRDGGQVRILGLDPRTDGYRLNQCHRDQAARRARRHRAGSGPDHLRHRHRRGARDRGRGDRLPAQGLPA